MPRRGSDLSRALRRGDRQAWATVTVIVPIWILAPAFFPGLLWRRRLGLRGHLSVVVAQVLWSTVMRELVLPRVQAFEARNRERRQKVRRELADELGREPTEEEVDERNLVRLQAVFAATETEVGPEAAP